MKNSFSEIIKYLTAFAIISGALGLIIINLHLQHYSLVDFNIIKPQIIYVGFIFLLTLIINYLVFIMFLDLENPENNRFIEITIVTFVKMVFLGNLLNYILNADQINQILTNHGKSSFIHILISGTTIYTISLPLISLIAHDYIVKEREKKLTKVWIYVLSVLILWSILGGIYSYIKIPLSKNYYTFELYLGFIVYGYLIGLWAVSKDRKKGFDVTPVSIFGKKVSGTKSIDKVFFGVYGVIMMSIIITKYTNKIYPNISPYFGGGKPQTISLVIGADTLKGNLIFQNEKYLFLEKDSSIHKLDWSVINSILIINPIKRKIQTKVIEKQLTDSLSKYHDIKN
jgi:hypothetical protein